VFRVRIPVPEFKIQFEESEAALEKVRAQRKAAEAAERLKASNAEAQEIFDYYAKLNEKVHVPEIPPPLSLLFSDLRGENFRTLKWDPSFSSQLARVCERCHCVVSSVNSSAITLEASAPWQRPLALADSANSGVEKYRAGLEDLMLTQRRIQMLDKDKAARERALYGRSGPPPPSQVASSGLSWFLNTARTIVEEDLRSEAPHVEDTEVPPPPTLDSSTLSLISLELHSNNSLNFIQERVEKERLHDMVREMGKTTSGLEGGGLSDAKSREWLGVTLAHSASEEKSASLDSIGGLNSEGGLRVSSPGEVFQTTPSLQRPSFGGFNSLLPSSQCPKPEGYVYRGSPILKSLSAPLSSPASPILSPASPSLPPTSPLSEIMGGFCKKNGLPLPFLSLSPPLQSPLKETKPAIALPAYSDDRVGIWSDKGFTQPSPNSGFLGVGCVRMDEGEGKDDSGKCRATPCYLAIIRKAHECELDGMVWRVKNGETPIEGFEATPFAIHLVSARSGRSSTAWLRLTDMRKSINPLVVKALAWAEGERGAAALQGGDDAYSSTPLITPMDFFPPPHLMHTVVIQAILPRSGNRGVERKVTVSDSPTAHATSTNPSSFLNDTPRTTLPMPPPRHASSSKYLPSCFHFNLLLAALPETAALLPATSVPPSKPLEEILRTLSPSPSHPRPYMNAPRSQSIARENLCKHVHSLYSPFRQPLFLLRRFSPATSKTHVEVGEVGGGEAWLTFSQLCAPQRSVHPTILYAARAKLLAWAGFSQDPRQVYGFRLSSSLYTSLPSPGAVQRLIPGHFMGGRGAVDKSRGFVPNPLSEPDASLSAQLLVKQTREATVLRREWRETQKTIAGLTPQGKERGDNGALPKSPPPSTVGVMQAIIPRPRAALKMHELRPVDVKSALELLDSYAFSVYEKEFWEAGDSLGLGVLARRTLVRRDGSVLHCQLWAGFPEELGKDEAMIALEKKIEEQMKRTGGKGNSALLAAASRASSGVNSRFMFRVRFFASNTRVITSQWVEPGDMMRPLMDPHAYDHPMDPDAHFPGSPFLEAVSHLATCGLPLAAREVPIVTRLCGSSEIQTWVGKGEVLGSLELARMEPSGPHKSVTVGGVYLLSLWMRPPCSTEDPLLDESLGGVSQGARAWEWDEADEGYPLRVAENATLTMVQCYANVGGDAGYIRRQPPPRKGLPRFMIRAQYVRQPFPSWESPSEHDARVSSEPGVRMSARMASAEFLHWTNTGNFPSSARLPLLQTSKHSFDVKFPRVRFQTHGTVQPWLEPSYAYAASLDDLQHTALNPFLEALPRTP